MNVDDEKPKSLYECKKVIYVRLRKDCGFDKTGNYGFCTINENSMNALQPCCENLCPLGLKVGEVSELNALRYHISVLVETYKREGWKPDESREWGRGYIGGVKDVIEQIEELLLNENLK